MPEWLHLAAALQCVERTLNRALARSERHREAGAGPAFAIGEHGEHVRMRVLDRLCQHDDFVGPARREREASLRGADGGERPKHPAKPADFDSKPRAMRLVGVSRSERAREQRVARHVARPRFGEDAREREQHRPPHERDHGVVGAHDTAARVDDERRRREQRFDVVQHQHAFVAARDQPCGGRVQHAHRLLHLRGQRRNAGVARGACRAAERQPRFLHPDAANCDGCGDEMVRRAQRRRLHRRVECSQRTPGVVQVADEERTPGLQVARMRGIHAIAVGFERLSRGGERLDGPAEIARHEGDLRLRDDTARSGNRLPGGEPARGGPQERFRPREIAELRHGNAAQRERGGVVSERDARQRAQRISGRERSSSRSDQRVHLRAEAFTNPVTLVTPAVRTRRVKSIPVSDECLVAEAEQMTCTARRDER